MVSLWAVSRRRAVNTNLMLVLLVLHSPYLPKGWIVSSPYCHGRVSLISEPASLRSPSGC